MYETLCELETHYSNGNTNSTFWDIVDMLSYEELKPWLNKLIRTKSFNTKEWFDVCSILHGYEQYTWTDKQRRFCVIQLLRNWNNLLVEHNI